jgi:predicted metalloenzyme YecM
MATTDPGIGTAVRYFLHYSNLASSFYKQYGSAKKVKDEYEQQIINTLRQSGMENATIQINGGQITVINKREPNQLSLSKIEELLHGYFRQKGGPDQSLDIMTFIRANRGYTMNKSLKQSGIQQPHASVPQQQLQ